MEVKLVILAKSIYTDIMYPVFQTYFLHSNIGVGDFILGVYRVDMIYVGPDIPEIVCVPLFESFYESLEIIGWTPYPEYWSSNSTDVGYLCPYPDEVSDWSKEGF